MATVSRLCPACGESSPLDSQYCAHCGENTRAENVNGEKLGDVASGTNHNSAANNPPNGSGNSSDERLHQSIQLSKAALPLIAGAAGFLVRVGWKLLQSRAAQDAALNAANSVIQSNLQKNYVSNTKPALLSKPALSSKTVSHSSPAVRKRGRTIRISSKWAVGDANGILRQGQSEHTIEIDD